MSLDSTYLQVSDGSSDAALMHITNDRSIGSTTIEVDTVSGIPDKFIASSGTILPSGFIDASTIKNFYGHLDGANLEIDGFLPGSTDAGNTAGQVVAIKPNTFWANLVASIVTAVDPANTPGGWILSSVALSFGSSDTAAGGSTSTNGVSTYTATASGDWTSTFSVGMKFRMVNSTTKYFFLTKISYSGGTTTFTFFGGTDYALTNTTISNVYYSSQKAPYGFPLDPVKWTVETKNTSSLSQASPVTGTWYNLSSLGLTVPIGSFVVEYNAPLNGSKASTTAYNVWSTLSTGASSESDPDFSTIIVWNGASSTIGGYGVAIRSKPLSVASKTQYYLNCRTSTGGSGIAVGFDGSQVPTLIRARCAYL